MYAAAHMPKRPFALTGSYDRLAFTIAICANETNSGNVNPRFRARLKYRLAMKKLRGRFFTTRALASGSLSMWLEEKCHDGPARRHRGRLVVLRRLALFLVPVPLDLLKFP